MERKPLTFGSLFAGIGGFDLGLERAGMVCKWQVELDDYASRVLAKHWPNVPRHDDVRTFPTAERDWSVDLVCGGFPCQDISIAGKGAGLAGERSGLWYEFARILGDIRPRWAIIENVPALTSRGLDAVLCDLASLGFDAEWHVIPASAVGAPHRRERIWIVAHASGERAWDFGGASGSYSGRDAWRHEPALRQGDGQAGPDRLRAAGETAGNVADSKRKPDAMRRDCEALPSGMARRSRQPGGSQRDSGAGCTQVAGQGGCHVADADFVPGPQQLRDELWREGTGDALGGRLVAGGSEGNGWWETEPSVGRVANGVPGRGTDLGDLETPLCRKSSKSLAGRSSKRKPK